MSAVQQQETRQLIVVDDEEIAKACAPILPAFDWTGVNGEEVERIARGRKCVVVGRGGAAGHLALNALAKRIHQAGAAEVKLVEPERSRPAGWGLDSALKDHWDGPRLLDWFRANRKPFVRKEDQEKKGIADLWAQKKAEAEAKRKENPLFQLWQSWNLQLSQNGLPLANLHNAVSVIENDAKLKDLFWFDSFLQRVMTNAEAPREWADADDITLTLYIQREVGLNRVGRELVSQAVLGVSHHRVRHSVRDWLDSLTHDGTQRLESFFSDCFGADDGEYTQAASRNFWLSMVARAYHPGCKVDNMVVLEGAQGIGKSQALQIIGADWFAEQHESATNPKGFAEILQGKLLVEISEMDSFNRAEVNRVKQTISCPSDRFRASYGHYAQDHPRQCIFVGTTNRDDWNRDETGARRFWPIACKGDVDLATVRANREQLFAEAAARYKAGEKHWLMPTEATKDEQSSRFQADPWLQNVETIVKGESSITTATVAEKLGIPLERRDRGTEMRIGACLRFMGWQRKQVRIGNDRAYVYEKT